MGISNRSRWWGVPCTIAAAALIVFARCEAQEPAVRASPSVAAAEYEVMTPDSVVLAMTWLADRIPDSLPVPVVVLLPMNGHDRSSWHGFDTVLSERGFKVLSVDQRGHGASDNRAGQPYSFRDFTDADYALMAGDLELVLVASHVRGADMNQSELLDTILMGADFSKLAIAGASIGSSVALIYAADHPVVEGIVLLSPGLNYRGLATEPPMRRYRGRPVYLAAAVDDRRSAEAVAALYELSDDPGEPARARTIHSGRAHGTDLFEGNRAYRDELADWIANALNW